MLAKNVLRYGPIILIALLAVLSLGSNLAAVIAQVPTATPAITIVTATPAPTLTPTATPDPPSVPVHGLFETRLPYNANPAQAEVDVEFVSPGGARFVVPGFWMQPQQRSCGEDCTIEIIRPEGRPEWRVRFSPPEPGRWTYTARARQGDSAQVISQGAFNAVPSEKPGIIQVSQNRRYFGRTNGTPFFPVGVNLGWSWSGARNTLGYEEWLRDLAALGANYARLYVDVPWFIGFGWRAPVTEISSIQEDAWRLDAVLQTAEQYGVALQLVLLWHQGWTTYGGLPVNPPLSPDRPRTDADWFRNPHNLQLGGPFNTAASFFASPQGRDLFKQRLRYIVARWGYSSSVFAWEVVDQLDRIVANNPDVAVDWLREMAAYLREIDPYRHPITAGVRDPARLSLLDPVVLDFRQVRYYQRRPIETAGDQILGAMALMMPLLNAADRPVLLSEFSLGPWFEPMADDPTGVHIRTTMWASALFGAGGAAASWWWDTYLFPQDLTDMLAPLAAFTRGVPWNTAALRPVNVTLVTEGPVEYQPLRVAGFNGTFGSTTPRDVAYRLTADGVNPPISTASSYLYGVTYNVQLSGPQTYIVSPPVDTRFTIAISRTSDRAPARLVVILDGKTQVELALSANTTPTSLSIPLSAGEHTLVLDNLGDDYLQIDSITVESYITPLRSLALADKEKGLFLALLQHRDYTWQNVAAGNATEPISVGLHISGMPSGMYRMEIWDPFTGQVVGQEGITVSGTNHGDLDIPLLPISRMLAVRAIRIAEPGNMPSPTPTFTVTPRLSPTPTSTPTPYPTPTPRASPMPGTPASPTPLVVGQSN